MSGDCLVGTRKAIVRSVPGCKIPQIRVVLHDYPSPPLPTSHLDPEAHKCGPRVWLNSYMEGIECT